MDIMEESFLSHPSLDSFTKELVSDVVKATKQCSSLPSSNGDEFEYYSSFQGYKTFCSRVGARLNKLIGRVLEYEQIQVTWPSCDNNVIATTEEIDEQFEALVEVNDHLLERVSTYLDQASGVKHDVLSIDSSKSEPNVASWNKQLQGYGPQWKTNIPRPQLKFKDIIDNSDSPFIPILRVKPNALKPLPPVFQALQNPCSLQALIDNAKKWAESPDRFLHPYEYEIKNFQPRSDQLILTEPQDPCELSNTPLIMVSTEDGLQEMLQELKQVNEIAVDLEAHSYRSFQGFVCLMQVSTRTCDYIVDTLILRHQMFCLNEVFTDPKIVKVMHGADWDVLWLQRDFGIYIVNLFDTGQASRLLNLPRYSLAFLLQYCCNLTVDKHYQLADWRIRPLPPDMMKYAREDTHYLLYIHDRMRNELIRRSNKHSNLLMALMEASRNICLKQYEKPILHKDDYLKLYKKFKRPLNSQQLYCLKLLYEWRWQMACQEDESTGYVLPNHMLFQLAEILPRESQGIIACCSPVPILLRQQLNEVHRIITMSRESIINEDQISTNMGEVATTSSEILSIIEDDPINEEDYITIFGPPVNSKDKPTIILKNVTMCPPLIQDKVAIIQEGFKNVLALFVEPLQYNDSLVLQKSFKTPETEKTTPTKETASEKVHIDKATPISVTKVKRPLPLNSKSGPQMKKPRTEEMPDIESFDYNKTTFTNTVTGSSDIIPFNGKTTRDKSFSVPRSKVKMKVSNKSGTFRNQK